MWLGLARCGARQRRHCRPAFAGHRVHSADHACFGGGTHELYAFSVEPYRLIEVIWPNVWGAQFGANTYWARLIRMPGAYPKIWVPSLYLGGLTFVLAAFDVRNSQGPALASVALCDHRRERARRSGKVHEPDLADTRACRDVAVPMSSAVTTDLGPIDKFDTSPIREDGFLRDGDGSVYWMLATFLPGFRQFRFPAKLFTFTVLGMAALAGLGWDRLCAGVPRHCEPCAILLALTRLRPRGRLRRTAADSATIAGLNSSSMFGPIDADGAVRAIIRCLVHATVVLALGFVIITLARVRRPCSRRLLMLVLVTCDLGVANARYVFTVPQAFFETKPEVLELIEAEERARPSPGPFRVHRMPLWNPPGWNKTTSADRVNEIVAWERGTLQPKYGIDLGVEYTHTIGVAELYDYEWFFTGFPRTVEDANRRASLGIKPGEQSSTTLAAASTCGIRATSSCPDFPTAGTTRCGPTPHSCSRPEPIYPEPDRFTGQEAQRRDREWVYTKDYRIQRNEQEFPRAWVVHQCACVKRPVGLSRETRAQAIEEMLYAE